MFYFDQFLRSYTRLHFSVPPLLLFYHLVDEIMGNHLDFSFDNFVNRSFLSSTFIALMTQKTLINEISAVLATSKFSIDFDAGTNY